jgi:hypothetical protein
MKSLAPSFALAALAVTALAAPVGAVACEAPAQFRSAGDADPESVAMRVAMALRA